MSLPRMPATLIPWTPAHMLTRMPATSIPRTPAHMLTRTTHLSITQPSNKDAPAYQSSFRKSSYRDTRGNNQRNRNSRSRSPVRGGEAQKGRSSSPDNTRDKNRREGFSRGAGSRGRSACAVCLGRFAHDIRHCNASNLWDGSNAHCRRTQDGRIVNPQGLPLCYKWQRPESCAAPNHESSHECSGCGGKDHGAQKCSRVEKA